MVIEPRKWQFNKIGDDLMHILVKCWTPEHYDAVSHAVIEMDLVLVDNLLEKIALADRMETEQELLGNHLMGLVFDGYEPDFINLDTEDLGLTEEHEEQVEGLEFEGYFILPANLEKHEWVVCSMRPVMQMAMAANGSKSGGRIYWYAYDKHGDASCRAETYSLHEKDLREIREALV